MVILNANGRHGMIHSHLSSTLKGKYHSRLVSSILVLSICMPFARIQAYPALIPAHEASPAQDNTQIRRLEQGKPVDRELNGGESHSYQVAPAAGQYVKV